MKSKGSLKKNCDYSDIVPISFYTHPSEGDRDSNYRDKIDEIVPPPLPPVELLSNSKSKV